MRSMRRRLCLGREGRWIGAVVPAERVVEPAEVVRLHASMRRLTCRLRRGLARRLVRVVEGYEQRAVGLWLWAERVVLEPLPVGSVGIALIVVQLLFFFVVENGSSQQTELDVLSLVACTDEVEFALGKYVDVLYDVVGGYLMGLLLKAFGCFSADVEQ